MTGHYEEDSWPKKVIGREPEDDVVESKQQTMRQFWMEVMRENVKFRTVSIRVSAPIMNANLKYIRSFGLTDDDIRRKIQLFADEVRTGGIQVHGREAWYVFMSRWQKLAPKGGASSYNDEDVKASWENL